MDTQISVIFIGIDQLIVNKEVAARPKDQEDLKYLRIARENRRRKKLESLDLPGPEDGNRSDLKRSNHP